MFLFGVSMMIRFFVLLLFLCVSNVFAGPLNDINNQIINNTLNKPIDSPAWFKDNPNLKILFLEKYGSKALFSWVGEGDGDFFRQDSFYSEKIKFKDPFVIYSADYVNKERELLKISIYVPHPMIASTVELGLNDKINEFFPPQIKTFFEKKVNLKDVEGKLYLHKSNACSIVLNFPSNAVLRTYKKDCKNSDELVKFTEGFDLTRLKIKLSKPKKDSNL